MAVSPIDLYRDVLPQTNCGDCGFSTCMAFASMVVSEQIPLSRCPHLSREVVEAYEKELQKQYEDKKWTKRDTAEDALEWAKKRSASMALPDLAERIGGRLTEKNGEPALELPFFNSELMVAKNGVSKQDGTLLNHWEQVFIYNHMAQGGSARPSGKWKSLIELPNTVSKIKSMKSHVEAPLVEAFSGRPELLADAAEKIGGSDKTGDFESADKALLFNPLPRIPVLLMFWDSEPDEGFSAEAKLLFDETVTEHLDIESIMFLSERIRELLIEHAGL